MEGTKMTKQECNAGNNHASGAWVINAVRNTRENQPRVIKCYNYKGEAQEAGVVLDEEQHDFLADSLEETDECEDLQLQATPNFKPDHADIYDSDCDDEAIANSIFMANLSLVGSLNDDTIAPHYDSNTLSEKHDFLADNLEETDDCEDLQLQATTNFKADHVDAYDSDCDDEATTNTIFTVNLFPISSLNDGMVAPCYDFDTLSEVPHYDTYHDFDVLNSNIKELRYIENNVSTNKSYDELKGNNDVISYTDYMLTIGDDAYNYVPPHIQKNDMMLFVIEQMKSQVENCNKVNQESKSEIESLTSELE
ncbi:hypothetical protein Tco_1039548 [Tanacetum coccineum]